MVDTLSDLAVVTGAASGIGRAVSLALAADGRAVALVDIDTAAINGICDEARDRGAPVAVPIVADVAVEEELVPALEQTFAEHGSPSAAFANAGIEINRPAHELDSGTWNRVLDVNLTGVFLTVRSVLAAMVAAGTAGSIVCTASPAAFAGFAGGGNAAYGASKGGVVAFVKSVAVDYARFGIRVNAIVPGAIDTPLLRLAGGDGQAELLGERAAAAIPLGRLGRADEVADVVMWLLSAQASYVTGATITCDGGLTARSANDF